MSNCNYITLLNGVTAAVTSLGLTANNAVIPVSLQMETSVRGWQSVPLLEISPTSGGSWERLFGKSYWVPYGVQVALIVAGNQDLVTQLANSINLKSEIKRLLADPEKLKPFGISSVASVDVSESDSFDKSLIPDGYAATGVELRFTCLEDHS